MQHENQYNYESKNAKEEKLKYEGEGGTGLFSLVIQR